MERARLESLYELSMALATTNSAQQIAARTLEAFASESDCVDAWAVEVAAEADQLEVLFALEQTERIRDALDPSGTAAAELLDALKVGRALWLDSATQLEARLPALAGAFPETAAFVLLPLRPAAETVSIGAVGVSFARPRPRDDDELGFFEASAELAGQALHVGRQHRDASTAHRAAAQAADRAERVGALAAALLAAHTVDEVTGVLGAHLMRALRSQTFSLREIVQPQNVARAIALGGAPVEYLGRFPDVHLDRPSAITEVIASSKPVFLASVENNRSRYGVEGAERYAAAGIEGMARLPLLVEGELIAILSVGFWESREFPDSERLFLTTVADLAAQALGRAKRSERLRTDARRNRLLAEAQAAINRRLDPADQLRALSRVTVPELADLSSVHVLATPVPPGVAPPVPVITERVATESIEAIPRVPLQADIAWYDGDPIVEAIHHGRLWTLPTPTPQVPEWATRTGSATTFRAGLKHMVLAPVLVEGLVVAVATLGMCTDRAPWTREDLAIIEEIAGFAAVALGHGLSYKHTRDTALVLQHSLLSAPPLVPGLELAARYLPAGRDEVGGDWFDAFELGPGHVALAVGDVVGHDITAAAAMGQLRAVLRTLAVEANLEPAAVVDRLAAANRLLGITPFATAVFGRLVRLDGQWELAWTSAGHLPPVLVEPGVGARLLEHGETGGGALGRRDFGRRHCADRVQLGPGSVLVFYTDGLVERRGTDLYFSIAELCERAVSLAQRPIEELCEGLLQGAPDRDDIALLVVRIDEGDHDR